MKNKIQILAVTITSLFLVSCGALPDAKIKVIGPISESEYLIDTKTGEVEVNPNFSFLDKINEIEIQTSK